MSRLVRTAAVLAVGVVVNSCGSPATPAAGYMGQWSGVTTQNAPITFTISTDETVTSIAISHNFNGCSGTQTFAPLSLPIAPDVTCIPGPCPPSISSYRAFSYASGDRTSGPSMSVQGLFVSANRAEGTVNFSNYPGCGSAAGVTWAASRR